MRISAQHSKTAGPARPGQRGFLLIALLVMVSIMLIYVAFGLRSLNQLFIRPTEQNLSYQLKDQQGRVNLWNIRAKIPAYSSVTLWEETAPVKLPRSLKQT